MIVGISPLPETLSSEFRFDRCVAREETPAAMERRSGVAAVAELAIRDRPESEPTRSPACLVVNFDSLP